MKKALLNIFSTVAALLILWAVISFFDVISNNMSEAPQYLPFNLFELLF